MVLWRISRFINLKGIGGLRSSGRWNNAGLPVVYLAESPAGALLEVCANTSSNDVPATYTLLRTEGPELECPAISLQELPPDWTMRLDSTRAKGDKWLRIRSSVLLKIPSALVPHTSNYIFNPLHPDAVNFSIVETYQYPFDVQIKK